MPYYETTLVLSLCEANFFPDNVTTKFYLMPRGGGGGLKGCVTEHSQNNFKKLCEGVEDKKLFKKV